MTEAQRGAALTRGDGIVGLLDHVAQQGALDKGHAVAVLGRIGPVDIPIDVLQAPQLKNLAAAEVVVQVDVVKEVVPLQRASHVEHVAHELAAVHVGCGPGGVVDQL